VAPFAPYVAVLIGMYGLHSAWAAVFGYHLSMALVLTLDGYWAQARRLGAGGPAWLRAGGALFGIGGGAALYLLWPWLGVPAGFGRTLAQLGLTEAAWPLFLVYFCAVNPALEELYWRGYLHHPSRRLIPNDLLFAGYHLLVLAGYFAWPWLIAVFIGLTAAAWLWRQLARHTGGLLVPYLSHVAADAGIMGAVYVLVVVRAG